MNQGAMCEQDESASDFSRIQDVTITLSVELGRVRVPIRTIISLGQGSVIELASMASAPLDIFANGRFVGRGEVIVVNEKFGIRITELASGGDRLAKR